MGCRHSPVKEPSGAEPCTVREGKENVENQRPKQWTVLSHTIKQRNCGEWEREWLLSAADEVIEGEGVAVPHCNVNLPQAFNEVKHKFLLETRVLSTIYINSTMIGYFDRSRLSTKSTTIKVSSNWPRAIQVLNLWSHHHGMNTE